VKYFGSFRFDDNCGTLVDAGVCVPLTRKAASLLHCLIARAPACVSRDDILTAVWPETQVQPGNIKVLISEIRHALADDVHDPRFIRSEPGRGYAFIGPVADAGLPQASRAGSDPIVATRLSELGILQEHFEAAAGGTPRMVFISGERGSGRTSLCEVFLARAAAEGGALVAYAQGLEAAGAAEPCGVLYDLLLQLRERYPERVDRLLSRHPGALPRGLAGRRKAPFAVARAVLDICHVIGDVARDGPLILVIDDLQWCDRYTLDVFRAISRWRHTPAPVLCVSTYAVAPAGRMTASLRSLLLELRAARCAMVPLRPLDASGVDRLIATRFDGAVARAIGTAVLEMSGGHPGVVAAILQHLGAGAGMNLPVSYWSRVGPAATTAVLQDGAREAILWRLANLDRGDRAMLEAAALVGMSFTSADVAIGLARSVSAVAPSLERLAAWSVILPAGDAAGNGYRFWHPLHAELLARGAGRFDLLRAASNLNRGRAGRCEIA
jgi:DNA-binding winged helix-turn-helix (wHTH) protein